MRYFLGRLFGKAIVQGHRHAQRNGWGGLYLLGIAVFFLVIGLAALAGG